MITNFNSEVRVEKNILSKEMELLKEKRIVLITTPTPFKLFGHYFQDLSIYKIFVSSNDITEIEKIAANTEVKNCDLIIGFGAGICMDVAKTVARIDSKQLISIPSVLSCNVFATNKSVIFENGKAKTINSRIPDKVLIDVDLIKKSDNRHTYSGLSDVLSIYTALYDWELAIEAQKEEKNEVIMNFAKFILLTLLDNYNLYFEINDESIKMLSEALLLSGYVTNMFGSGRPESGSEHMFSRAIEESNMFTKRILHGEAVMLGILLCSELQNRSDDRLYIIARKMNLLSILNELELHNEFISEFLLNASTIRLDRYSIYNTKKPTKEDCDAVVNRVMTALKNEVKENVT